ncbi:MAG: tetratricopeptide repeat protein [Ferruginibacter sp.]
MIKNIGFVLLLAIIALAGCNSNTDEKDVTSSPEKELRDRALKYPDSLLLKENLIQYFRDNSNYAQAITETENALKKDSLNDRLWDIKATLYFEKSDTLQAIESFEKAINLNPKEEYIISLGSLYAQTKNPRALSLADGLLQAPSGKAQREAIFIKGLYYSYSGDKLKAISFFDQCLLLNFRDVLAYREKAICLYDLGRYAEALAALEKAISVQTTFDEGYYWMGRCYQKLNKNKEAIASYQQALQIDPDYMEAKDALGKMGIKQ